ncbi:transmembrane 4 L6 family member 1 isoform X2 [Ictalurus furcatus]|uniref:transmembrane 4 L6 family member 1 isoform X2 n=1 Tax=Ictalurus furcatus TaxID=66913 RepID=UPI002350F492|nr:transmembrane 4 L6 family member 1 isoform X2 [Ictalurus furcatus]
MHVCETYECAVSTDVFNDICVSLGFKVLLMSIQVHCIVKMCSICGSKYLPVVMILLAVVSMLANLLLLFPGLTYKYLFENHVTPEATWCTGIWASGFVVLVAVRGFASNDTKTGCCQFRADMLCRIVYSCVAVVGAGLCFLFNCTGLTKGPLCLHNGTEGLEWERPLRLMNMDATSYLYEPERWASACEEPRNVVVWNIVLFSTIMAVNGLQAVFCVVQILNAVHGVIFGPSKNKVVHA